MKLAYVLILTLALPLSAHAANTTKTNAKLRAIATAPAAEETAVTAPAPANQTVAPAPKFKSEISKNAYRKGMEFTASYSFAQDVKGSWSSAADGGASFNSPTGGAPALGMRFINVKPKEAGIALGASMELSRTLDTVTTTDNVANRFAKNANFSMFIVESNATYGLSEKAYVLGGLNYALPFASGFGASTLQAGLGVQAGAGFSVDSAINIEAVYRSINMNIIDGGVSDGNAKLWGFMFRGSYQFF